MVKDWIPISHDNYKQVQGPFYHGTKANLAIGDLLTTGFISHFEDGRILKHIYFSALMEPAVWGAELAMSLSGLEGRGGTVAKLAMRQPFVLFKGLTFQKLCLPGAFRPGDHHNKMLRPG
ncbi:NAD(+)--rifampin ADP-ribosyltransferase, partial [Salmonella enterica]